MHFCITGANGNLGVWLCHHLLSTGHQVTAFSRKQSYVISDANYQFVAGDLCIPDTLRKLDGLTFDVCIHLASYNEFFEPNYRKKALQINTLGTAHLCEYLLEKKVPQLIYMSTFHVYGDVSSEIIDESSLCRPKNDYALTHLFAEQYIQSLYQGSQQSYINLRLTNSYGAPKDIASDKWYLIINDMARQAFFEKKIILTSNGTIKRDFVWMGDVCQIIAQLAERNNVESGVYNLSSGQSIALIDIAKSIQQAYQHKYQHELEICINDKDQKEYPDFIVSNRKLLTCLDFEFSKRVGEEAQDIWTLLETQAHGA